MKYLAIIAPLLLVFAGCASMEEAYVLDREFGKAQMAAWDQQIINKNHPHGTISPEGIEGITAEEIMGVYNGTFSEKPEQTNVFNFGVEAGK